VRLILAGVAGVYDYAPVPVVGHGGHDAVNVFAVEQFLIMPRGGQARVAGNFFGERMAPVVQVSSAHALDARNGDRSGEQP
jgi:hypothetical protein